jgi:elongation factor P
MTIGYGDLKRGLPIELDGEPYVVVEYKSRKMQQRAPVMQVRFRSLKTGRIVDRSFQGYDVKLTLASVERRSSQYIYEDDGMHYFMDTETFDQFPLAAEQVEDALPYMVVETTVQVVFHEGQPIAIDLPVSVELKVTEAPPGHRGDTAQGGTKPIKLETGLTVQAPLFVSEGETVRVDTRNGEYLARV